jgi:tetratricopeptide (TPR) repeat protein
MKQVLLLLQSQQENVKNNPEVWAYWQRRAGNEIANQLYKEGDYMNSLQIYQNLLDLDESISWKAPVWYQIGLIYEQLQQWPKATETYDRIIAHKKELTAEGVEPSLGALCDMAQWRKDYIAWADKARVANREFQQSALYSTNKTSAQ